MSRKPIAEKIEKVKADLERLENEKKRLLQEQSAQERKAKTHRLCKRGGLVESLLPDLATLTDEQFNLFVDNTLLTDHTRRILAEIVSGRLKPPTVPQSEIAASSSKGGNPNGAILTNGRRADAPLPFVRMAHLYTT